MALMADRGKGWPVGIGLAVLAVSAGPKLMKAGRPLLKRAIKGYLTAQDRAKEMLAESTERVQDLYAEAKHEHEEEQTASRAESDLMPEPEMVEATKPAEGSRRAPRAKREEHQELDG